MSGTRVPFDPSLPFIVATQDLPCGSWRGQRGDAFPWRDLGVSPNDLLTLWVAHKVDTVAPIEIVPRDLAPGEMLVDAMLTEIDAPAFIGAASTLAAELATITIDAPGVSTQELAADFAELEALTAPDAPSATPDVASSAEPEALSPAPVRTSTQTTSLDVPSKPTKPPRRGR